MDACCFAAIQLEEPREWHFTLRGPPDSPFEGGMYHGRIVLPKNYPFAPPSLMLLTRNGRFDVNKKVRALCAPSSRMEIFTHGGRLCYSKKLMRGPTLPLKRFGRTAAKGSPS